MKTYGIATDKPPYCDVVALRNMVLLAFAGAVSRKFITTGEDCGGAVVLLLRPLIALLLLADGGRINMNPPPPIPDEKQLTVPIQMAEAIAESTAFPPSLITCNPMAEHSVCSVATAAVRPMAGKSSPGLENAKLKGGRV